GNGGAFISGDAGQIVTGANVLVSGTGGANSVHASIGTEGVALPARPFMTATTTQPVASSNGTGPGETGLEAALASGSAVQLSDPTYVVTSPIVINVDSGVGSPSIDFGGAKIISQINGGGPVIEIIVGPGVNLGSLTLSNVGILGNGQDGDG